jgi:hypothetical protein
MKKKAYKKKNKFIPLIVCVVALALLGAAYYAMSVYNADQAAKEAAESEAANAKIMLAEYKNTDVDYIEYSYNGETVKLEYKNDYWYNADDNYFPLDQTQPASMATALASIAADRLVEDSTANFATYGLDSPYEYIDVKYTDNNELKLVFGDLNSFTGTRYMNIDGTGKVYLVKTALLDYFKYSHNDLISHDKITAVDISALTELDIANLGANGTTTTGRYYRQTDPAETGSTDTTAETSAETTATVWLFDNGSGTPSVVDEATVSDLLTSVTSLTLKTCAAYNVKDDETLRKYGLGTAAATTITVKYTESVAVADESSAISSTAARTVDSEYSVAYSAPDTDGSSYVNLVGSKLIYKLDTST